MAKISYKCALIVVEDVQVSRSFYENLLEQKVKHDYGENIVFEGDFAIHKKEHFIKLISKDVINRTSHSCELYFEADNLTEIEKKLEKKHVRFLHKIMEQPWKQQVMRFYDPDGHLIEIGESMEYTVYRLYSEGCKIQEIVKSTQMPEDFVKSAILLKDIKYYEGRIPACGIFCGGCPWYTRDKKPCPGAEKNKARCEKCKTFHLCCQEKGVEYCYQCEHYPCAKFKRWTKNWEKYGQNMQENQVLLKEKGEKALLLHYNSKIKK